MNKKIEKTCTQCESIYFVAYKYRNRSKFCCIDCFYTWNSGENNPTHGKSHRTKESHPEWAKKIRKTCLEKQINSGDSNGMKQISAREKVSKSRKEKFKTDSEFSRQHANKMLKAWADGKYENVKVGRCKWYDHVKPNGDVVKLQGTWELAYAKWLDAQNVQYKAHVGKLHYTDEEGIKRSYHPDFYLIESDEYVDVKNPFYVTVHRSKIERVKASNPEIKLRIVDKQELQTLKIIS